MHTTTCCNSEALAQYMASTLDLDGQLELFEHLEECQACWQRLYVMRRDQDVAAMTARRVAKQEERRLVRTSHPRKRQYRPSSSRGLRRPDPRRGIARGGKYDEPIVRALDRFGALTGLELVAVLRQDYLPELADIGCPLTVISQVLRRLMDRGLVVGEKQTCHGHPWVWRKGSAA